MSQHHCGIKRQFQAAVTMFLSCHRIQLRLSHVAVTYSHMASCLLSEENSPHFDSIQGIQ